MSKRFDLNRRNGDIHRMEDKTDLAVFMRVAQEAAGEADTAQLVRALADLKRVLLTRLPLASDKRNEAETACDAFCACFAKASSGALVYGRFLALADQQSPKDPDLRDRLLGLARLVAEDIATSLADGQSLILNLNELFKFSDREKQDIDYLFNSGACLDPDKLPPRIADTDDGKAYRDPDSILTLAWTLGVALSPDKA